jgi:hypothetical protein
MPYFKSKYTGRCYLCKKEIEVGEMIWWEQGLNPEHEACHKQDEADQRATDASPVKPVQKGVTVRDNPPSRKGPPNECL